MRPAATAGLAELTYHKEALGRYRKRFVRHVVRAPA